ncbi:MAG: hypothetical protein K0U86_04530 [Planctomycetes bacterium]|nr:hypothetical protein [Planctomycetota bacterium]MCH9724154.1 hypothetical protein [Planctomycetota bacterium]MCH9779171.1 hypothetical protein [Planctomycetota bacterium]MCH9792206.1 hypothetical protein [Planctomycetota bacterium]MDF1743834.1 hypothetical protein [Gimesia sp.]
MIRSQIRQMGVGVVALILLLTGGMAVDAGVTKDGASKYLKNVQKGNPNLKSVGKITFGPGGLLVVADPAKATITVIDTHDLGPMKKLTKKVPNIDVAVAASMGVKPEQITIADMAVNSQSGKVYLSVVRKTDRQPAILVIDAAGKVKNFDLSEVDYIQVALPGGKNSKIRNITGVALADDRLLAAAQSNEEFANKIYSIPLPLTHGTSADIYSAETYHVAHRRWETKAPIQSFVPYSNKGKNYIVGAFACTPIAKFPLDELQSGSKVKGTSIVELGSGNRPLDMLTYESDGKEWLLTNTFRFHWKKSMYGPSKWWGVRVNMDYLDAENTNEEAARRNVKQKQGPDGIEIVDQLSGAVHIDKLQKKEIVVLRDNEGHLDLEISQLP